MDNELYRWSSIGVVLWTTSPLALVLKPLGGKCSKVEATGAWFLSRLWLLDFAIWGTGCVAGHGALGSHANGN